MRDDAPGESIGIAARGVVDRVRDDALDMPFRHLPSVHSVPIQRTS
jgi:hypothetical protein